MNIYIFGEVNEQTVHYVIKQLAENDDNVVYVYIDSVGGCVEDGMAICGALEVSKRKIITYAVNKIYSCAIQLYLVGEERYGHPNAEFMIHEATNTYEEEAAERAGDLQKVVKELNEINESMFDFICSKTNLTRTKLKNHLKKAINGDWYFNSQIAKKYGFIHTFGFPSNKKK